MTEADKSKEKPALLYKSASKNFKRPSLVTPARYRATNGWRWPVMHMSMSRSMLILTARWSFDAATAAAQEMNTERVSLPPKPPPNLLVRQTTCDAGTPHTCAQKFC